jgi:hypothetical protein
VDTNVILEAHRLHCWTPIAQYFSLHTVSKVVEETQTGYQNRASDTWIVESQLRSSLKHVADVSEEQRASFNIRYAHPSLDAGERDLLIYAESLQATPWLLNSPDMAAFRFACSRGWIERLVSLEAMTSHLKLKLPADPRKNYTERWLTAKKTGWLLG